MRAAMASATHAYGIELCESDPLAEQPPNVHLQLKNHQRAALHKAMLMEQHGQVHYLVPNPEAYMMDVFHRRYVQLRGRFRVRSNIGVLGDIVGYGKTLTALSIIAATPVHDIYQETEEIISVPGGMHSHFIAHMEITPPPRVQGDDRFIHTTLVIVPRGPVFVQWERTIREHTGLRVLSLDSISTIRKLPGPGETFATIKAKFEEYDIVLVKNTSFKTLMDYYNEPIHGNPIRAFDRIMVDEAHELIHKIPVLEFKFLWMITGTYRMLLMRNYVSRTSMSTVARNMLNEERMNLLLICGKKEFVMRSFEVPPPEVQYYLCSLPAYLSAVQPFLNPNVLERVNANDFAGALRELGAKDETEADVVALVTREQEREIRNKEREIRYVESQEISAEAKEARISTLQADLGRLRERLASLQERVSHLTEKACPVCMDTYENPVLLPCTHVFCASCLVGWMRQGRGRACPQCRAPIHSDRMIAIVAQKESGQHAVQAQPLILSKEDTVMRLLQERPNGRFLIFSKLDSTFLSLTDKMHTAGVSHAEIKGSTCQMMKILERFKNGELRCIMLNSNHAGSGIDISCATDVIIFHNMGAHAVQACGRAQRVGRTSPLHIHHLCYPHEMDIASPQAHPPPPPPPPPLPTLPQPMPVPMVM